MDKQADQIRKMKKMLKIYSKKLKDGEGTFLLACYLQLWIALEIAVYMNEQQDFSYSLYGASLKQVLLYSKQ